MASYGMRDLDDVHGHGQRIVTMDRPYGEAMGFGKRIEAGMTGDEILSATGTDWEVEKVPAYMPHHEGGERIVRIPDTYGVRRVDTGQPFGNGRCVGRNYTPFQNRELVHFAEGLVEAAEGALQFEAGGYLKDGAVVWYQARVPESVSLRQTEFGEDKVEPFLFLLTAHDGTMSTTAHFTAHRLFCNNQIAHTLRGGQNRVTVRHTRAMHARMSEARRVLQEALGFFQEHVEEMRALDERAMSLDEMRRFAEELIGETQEAIAESDRTITAAQHARRVAQRDRLADLFRGGLGNSGRTRLDALNAVSEFADHHRTGDGDASRIRRLVMQAPDQDVKVRALRMLRR